ncbi:MAG: M56 family metallopeptidase [Bryobacteraceae bacterium]
MTFEIASKATILLAAAFAATALLKRRSAAERHMVYTACFAALLALPVLVWTLPSWSTAVAGTLFTVSASTGRGAPGPNWSAWLIWLEWTGTIVVLARLLFSHFFMWRFVSRLGGAPVVGAVVRHAEVPSAMTWGLIEPTILLPEDESRAAVLAHEQAHIDRFDGVWRLIAQLACAVYWFHPLVWIAARRAAQEAERACDDLVLAGGASPVDYASALVEEARTASLAALTFAPMSGLERRIRAMLDARTDRRPASRRGVFAVMAMVAMLLMPLAAVRAAEEVHKVGGEVTSPQVLYKTEPKYTEAARDAKIEGTTVLYCVITKDGKATDITVTTSLDPGLDENAVAALEQWTFIPGKKKGVPVAVAATIQVNFRLK